MGTAQLHFIIVKGRIVQSKFFNARNELRKVLFSALAVTFLLWPPYVIGGHYIFTGSIARSPNLPVFSLLRGRF